MDVLKELWPGGAKAVELNAKNDEELKRWLEEVTCLELSEAVAAMTEPFPWELALLSDTISDIDAIEELLPRVLEILKGDREKLRAVYQGAISWESKGLFAATISDEEILQEMSQQALEGGERALVALMENPHLPKEKLYELSGVFRKFTLRKRNDKAFLERLDENFNYAFLQAQGFCFGAGVGAEQNRSGRLFDLTPKLERAAEEIRNLEENTFETLSENWEGTLRELIDACKHLGPM